MSTYQISSDDPQSVALLQQYIDLRDRLRADVGATAAVLRRLTANYDNFTGMFGAGGHFEQLADYHNALAAPLMLQQLRDVAAQFVAIVDGIEAVQPGTFPGARPPGNG